MMMYPIHATMNRQLQSQLWIGGEIIATITWYGVDNAPGASTHDKRRLRSDDSRAFCDGWEATRPSGDYPAGYGGGGICSSGDRTESRAWCADAAASPHGIGKSDRNNYKVNTDWDGDDKSDG